MFCLFLLANTAAAVVASLNSNLIQRRHLTIGSPSSTSTISDASLDTALPEARYASNSSHV